MNAVLTVAEVAALYRCHPHTIRRSIARGELAHVRVMGVVRIPATALPAILTQPHDPAGAVVPSSHVSAGVVEDGASGRAGPESHDDPSLSTTEREVP